MRERSIRKLNVSTPTENVTIYVFARTEEEDAADEVVVNERREPPADEEVVHLFCGSWGMWMSMVGGW